MPYSGLKPWHEQAAGTGSTKPEAPEKLMGGIKQTCEGEVG